MNPNITLTEIARDEFEVTLRSRYIGVVFLNDDGTYTADDARDQEETPGFDTLGDAVDYLIG